MATTDFENQELTQMKPEIIRDEALSLVVQAWCRPDTSNIIMDPVLATAFTDILEKVLSEKEQQLAAIEKIARGDQELSKDDPAYSSAYEHVLDLRRCYEEIMNAVDSRSL